jgi:hypothetical protein
MKLVAAHGYPDDAPPGFSDASRSNELSERRDVSAWQRERVLPISIREDDVSARLQFLVTPHRVVRPRRHIKHATSFF